MILFLFNSSDVRLINASIPDKLVMLKALQARVVTSWAYVSPREFTQVDRLISAKVKSEIRRNGKSDTSRDGALSPSASIVVTT